MGWRSINAFLAEVEAVEETWFAARHRDRVPDAPRPPGACQMARRNEDIVGAAAAGVPYGEISEAYGVSRQRISQIVHDAEAARSSGRGRMDRQGRP
jgi:hypothetical protein